VAGQLASLGGIYLVTGVVIFTNAVTAHVLARLAVRRRPSPAPVFAWLGVMALAAGWALLRLQPAPAPLDARRLKVAVIQGNLDERARLSGRGDQIWVTRRMLAQSRLAASAGAKLVAWPEGSLPRPVPAGTESLARELGSAPGLGSVLVIGGIGYGRDDGRLFKTNSAFVTDGKLEVLGRYDKVHLVPFGEYVPLGSVLPWEWFVPAGTVFFSPGEGHSPIHAGDLRLGLLICYEAIFPEIARQAVDQGADLLVNITNDAWFGRSAAPYQHLVMSRMRSVETGRYQVRAANTGVSAMIDPCGRELGRIPIGLARAGGDRLRRDQLPAPARLTAEVALLEAETPYVALGNWLPWACVLASLAGVGLSCWRRRRPVPLAGEATGRSGGERPDR